MHLALELHTQGGQCTNILILLQVAHVLLQCYKVIHSMLQRASLLDACCVYCTMPLHSGRASIEQHSTITPAKGGTGIAHLRQLQQCMA
jgi:hypothetical protein